MTSSSVRRTTRITAAGAALALVASGAAANIAAGATPTTLTLSSVTSPSRTVTTTTVGGQTVTASLGLFNISLTPADGSPAVSVRGFCDDPLVGIGVGKTYKMALQDSSEAPELDGVNYRAAAYLIRTAPARIAAAADPGTESGAHQIASWQLGGRVRLVNPTNNAAMNARAEALRLEALATTTRAPGAGGSGSACAGTGEVTVTVSGAPGASAAVAVTSGGASVSAPTVTLDANGTATVRVTASAPGRSVVRVTLDTGALRRAVRVGTSGPQQTISVAPGSTVFEVPVEFTDCTSTPSVPGGGDVTPPASSGPLAPSGERPKDETPPAGEEEDPAPQLQRPGLTLRKTAPVRARLGGGSPTGSR